MKYPKNLKDNDRIGIVAPSNGIVKKSKIDALNKGESNLLKLGFAIDESDDVRKCKQGVSNDAIYRAHELMSYIKNKNIQCIIAATGGDFLIEILEYLDFNDILNNIKWVQGYSDITGLLYVMTVGLDIATIYSYNITGFGYNHLYESHMNNINILKGNIVPQRSFELFKENDSNEQHNVRELELLRKTCWKTLNKCEKFKTKGRIIGGCLDCLLDIVGTKFDYTKQFINKYSNDQIVWYFDVSDLTNEDILRGLSQLRHAGWFKKTNTILFGRIKNEISYTGISLNEAINRGLNNENICVFTDVNFGHTNPKMTIVNGAITNIIYNNGKGEILFELQ